MGAKIKQILRFLPEREKDKMLEEINDAWKEVMRSPCAPHLLPVVLRCIENGSEEGSANLVYTVLELANQADKAQQVADEIRSVIYTREPSALQALHEQGASATG